MKELREIDQRPGSIRARRDGLTQRDRQLARRCRDRR